MLKQQDRPQFDTTHLESYLQHKHSIVYGIPGSGKSLLAIQLACWAANRGHRVMVVTMNSWQSYDLCHRIQAMEPAQPVYLFHKKKKPLPPELFLTKNINPCTDLPSHLEPSIVISNAHKWSWVKSINQHFDLMIVDEAHQLSSMLFHQIKGLAERVVFINDPNLLRPIVTTSTHRWEDMSDGPHMPAVEALLAGRTPVHIHHLTHSYRLDEHSIQALELEVAPKQFPKAHTSTRHRLLKAENDSEDPSIRGLLEGKSFIRTELNGSKIHEHAVQILHLIKALYAANIQISDTRMSGPLNAAKLAVICANVTDAIEVEHIVSKEYPEILVESAEGIQGQERAITILLHPLCSKNQPTPFHLDYGRLATMASRHRIGCIVLTPPSIEDALYKSPQLGTALIQPVRTASTDWLKQVNFLGKITDKK